MNTVTLLTGGARSGKSRFALALSEPYENRTFVATAQVTDDEMAHRIKLHKQERGDDFTTIEAPIDLVQGFHELAHLTEEEASSQVVVIDCLTVWMGNLLHKYGMQEASYKEVDHFLEVIGSPPCDVVIVSNELGMGLVPETPMGRWFRDKAGRLNQAVAETAHRTCLLVSGQPLWIKTRSPQSDSK